VRILVLTFYYPPDLSAGSFRASNLVASLAKQIPPGGQIDVVTTLPNRYRTFTMEVPRAETQEAIQVRRVALPPHQSGMLDQSRAFWTFAREAQRLAAGDRYDLVFATSSRLMTATLGSWIARRQGAPLYLDIRDIFVDTMREVLPRAAALPMTTLLGALERRTIERASRVNLVSAGFETYFRERYPHQRFSYFTNGVDEEFTQFTTPVGAPPQERTAAGVKTIVYAGNVGDGQGLHAVLPELARRAEGRLRFRVIGDGSRRRELQARIEGLGNVVIVPPMARPTLMEEYRRADVLFLHLNDYEAFKRVLPSKVFEYAATGKPIWAGVGGYAARFLADNVDNVAIFTPCDASAAMTAFAQLDFSPRGRAEFVRRFSRRAISDALAADILATIR